MRVTSADAWALRPGTVHAWRVTAPPDPAGTPVDLSPDQRHHLGAAAAGEPSVWLTAAFDVDGPIDPIALERAFRDLVTRHGTLQCTAAVRDGTATARRHDPGSLGWRGRVAATTTTPTETRTLVRALLDEGCAPLGGGPALLPAAVSRPDRSTILLGLDHLHADATSVAVVVDDLHALYEAHTLGAGPSLPVAACFVETRAAGAPHAVPPTDPRLAAWHATLAGLGHRLPTFPLDLGVAPGERAPQASVVADLLDSDATDALDRSARAVGASTCATALSAFAGAVADCGGPRDLPVLLPVSTRRTPAQLRAVGWFTATVPLVLRADAGPGRTGRDLRAARELAGVPLDQVLDTLPAPLARSRGDVFMVSWLDYRCLPGQARARERAAHHVSASTRADDLQLWLSRTTGGLALRARMPATTAAHATWAGVVAAWRDRLTHPARLAEYLPGARGCEV